MTYALLFTGAGAVAAFVVLLIILNELLRG